MTVCSALNYEKLSLEALKHLARNPKFPPRTVAKAVIVSQQTNFKSLLPIPHHPKDFSDSTSRRTVERSKGKKGDPEPNLPHIRKLNLSTQHDSLRAHLTGMQWRVTELEKACAEMQAKIDRIMKQRLPAGSLPKLCS